MSMYIHAKNKLLDLLDVLFRREEVYTRLLYKKEI